MSHKNKNREKLISDFVHYQRDEMTGKERNSFEKKLQKDSFAEDAAEGFSLLSPEEISSDLNDLQNRIKSRTVKRQRYIVYRIAASVAVLMVISTLLFVINRNKTSKQLAINSVQSEKKQIIKEQPPLKQIQAEAPPEKPAGISEKKSGNPVSRQLKMEKSKSAVPVDNKNITEAQNKDSISEIRTEVFQQSFTDKDIAPTARALARAKTPESKEFEVKRDSQVQVRLDTSISALSEVVVVGYGSKRAESEKEDVSTGYTPPSPVNGKSDFDKYIKENQHRPDTITADQRAVVVVSFLVRINGSIDSIRIVKSPGKIFSDEAIRLIKSGPSWKPAENKGKPIEDAVRIRIVFR
jgi:hypothetical protein